MSTRRSAVDEDTAGQRLVFGVDFLDQLFGIDGGAQQRLQHGQQSLGFSNGKGSRHFRFQPRQSFGGVAFNNTTAICPDIGPIPGHPPQEFLTRTFANNHWISNILSSAARAHIFTFSFTLI